MDEKLIIETLKKSLEEGKITLDKVPEKYREKVQE